MNRLVKKVRDYWEDVYDYECPSEYRRFTIKKFMMAGLSNKQAWRFKNGKRTV